MYWPAYPGRLSIIFVRLAPPGHYRPTRSLLEDVQKLNWAVPLVALSIVGIELGWILAFRAGAGLSLTGLIVNVAVAVIVIPIGLLLFKEKISLVNLVGIALCLIGLVLISRKA